MKSAVILAVITVLLSIGSAKLAFAAVTPQQERKFIQRNVRAAMELPGEGRRTSRRR
jgi:hypothetical protein